MPLRRGGGHTREGLDDDPAEFLRVGDPGRHGQAPGTAYVDVGARLGAPRVSLNTTTWVRDMALIIRAVAGESSRRAARRAG